MFASLIGNQAVASGLRRLLANSRVPNAVLFAGPEGVGKKQFAMELAGAFVCTDEGDPEACCECAACRRIGTFSLPKAGARAEDYDFVFFSEHPDVGMVIPFNRTLRVGAIRKLESEANFRPFEARARFFIIDEADKMNDSASNALLKTLEEPPPSTHIVLITSRPDSLLQTIRSRCQVIRFTSIAASEIESHLLKTENWTNDDAALASRVCAGSVARALSLDIEKFRSARNAMLDVLESAGSRRVAPLLQASERLNNANNKDDFEANLAILESLIRDAWFIKQGGPESSLTNCDIAAQLAPLAANLNASSLARWLTEIETMRGNFVVNINRKIASDALFVKMAGV